MKNNGFIILEALVALAVLSVGITSLVLALREIAQANRRVRNHAIATLHAENIINRLSAGESFNSAEPVSLADTQFHAVTAPDGTFFQSGLKKYELTVFWRERNREHRRVFSFIQ
ncbi:MAG: hypothetical protein NC924_02190 [Candidatus Omnitrophica bacterium]|nr:hypothetical protein [Candidatus Omnitrophota bacterium]